MISSPSSAPPPHRLAGLRGKLQRLARGRDRWALHWQAMLAAVDLAILAFFLLGPYIRSGPTYLVIDYVIAVWICAEMAARAVSAPSFRTWISRAMTWIDIVVLALCCFRTCSTTSPSCG